MMKKSTVLGLAAAVIGLGVSAGTAHSMGRKWIHDTDVNGLDDRIERVEAVGLAAAHEGGDLEKRRAIAVFDEGSLLEYGVYIGFDRKPTESDVQTLRSLGLTGLKKYEYIDYIRARGSFAQLEAAARLLDVARVESIPMMYPLNHWGARVVRARDSRGLVRAQNYDLFPSTEDLGLDGTGVVVGILDTGVNDDVDIINPGFPGHEGLNGKFLGGGEFYLGDPLLNTGLDESMNPQDHGAEASSYHGTHVAGTVMGTGGENEFFRGMAPKARLVDCKVLSDAGLGFGSADGVEWCIHNMNNDWGLTGDDLIYSGIDVLNLSLGGVDASDGTDAGSQMINAAADAGLIVCIATGNDEAIDHISSPAAADKSIAVGATLHNQTFVSSDDLVTGFSNEGPRTDDGDGDQLDEMKPSVVAPGSGTMSADGDFLSEGEAYKKLSGTSMATPHVAGVCALLKQLDPGLDQLAVRTILRNTATHFIGTEKEARPNDPFGIDPNYNPACGWGLVDTYAAAKEVMNSVDGVQVVQLHPVARDADLEVDFHWVTQREYANGGFRVYRADDVDGAPGAFQLISGGTTIPSVGDAVIQNDGNRTHYTYVDGEGLELGNTYWYQLAWIDDLGGENLELPVPVTLGDPPFVVSVNYSIVHNAVDNDLTTSIGVSSAMDPENAEYSEFGAGASGADSVVTIEPANAVTATIGYLEHYWSHGLTEQDGVDAFLPATSVTPWFLSVNEGGFVNRFGRITSFSLFVYDEPGASSGYVQVTEDLLPAVLIETQTTTLWIGPNAASVENIHMSAVPEAQGIRVAMHAGGGREIEARISRSITRDPSERTPLSGEPMLTEGGLLEVVDRDVTPDVTYYYWAEIVGPEGQISLAGPVTGVVEGVRTMGRLVGNKPIRNGAKLQYVIAPDVASKGAVTTHAAIYDLQGRMVRELVNGTRSAGEYTLDWNADDDRGHRLGHGVYFLRFQAGSSTTTEKFVVVR